ncbi:hypothetical protein, partial [Streptomyces sp. NPDC002533]
LRMLMERTGSGCSISGRALAAAVGIPHGTVEPTAPAQGPTAFSGQVRGGSAAPEPKKGFELLKVQVLTYST